MSASKMTTVPVDALQRAIDQLSICSGPGPANRAQELRELLAKPAEQHQGDPAEVERLRAELETMTADRDAERGMKAAARLQRDEMSAIAKLRDNQLAERDALLKRCEDSLFNLLCFGVPEDRTEADQLIDQLRTLSASAEPSAPVVMKPLDRESAQILADNFDDLVLKSSAPVERDHDALVAAVCVLRSQGLGNLSEAVEAASTALERKP